MRFKVEALDNADLHSLFLTGRDIFSKQPQARQWTDTALADLLCLPSSICLVAKERKKITGFIAGEMEAGSHAVIHFFTAHEHPVHDEILKKLFNEFLKRCGEKHIEKINFSLDRESLHLLKFCATLGFQEQRTLVEMSLDIIYPAD